MCYRPRGVGHNHRNEGSDRLAVLQIPYNVDTISRPLSLKDFDVLHIIRQIGSIVVDGIQSHDRTTPTISPVAVPSCVSA